MLNWKSLKIGKPDTPAEPNARERLLCFPRFLHIPPYNRSRLSYDILCLVLLCPSCLSSVAYILGLKVWPVCVFFPATEPKAGFRTKLRRLEKYETKFELIVSIQNDFFSVRRWLMLCIANSKQGYEIWASETCLTLHAFIFFGRYGR